MKLSTYLLFLCWSLQPAHAQILEPIDSAYLNRLVDFSRNVNKIKENVWPGMTIGPSCIFRLNGPAFLIHHPQPPANAKYLVGSIYIFNPAEYGLMGTT